MADVTSTTDRSSRLIDHGNAYRRENHSSADRSSKANKTLSTTPKHPAAVARRNARERNRVRQVNMGFVTLRNHIPQNGSKAKKLSKVETLRQAASYIRYLREMLTTDESIGSPFANGASAVINCGNSVSSNDPNSAFYFTPTSAPTQSDAYYAADLSSPYSSNHFDQIAQQQKAHYQLSAPHLKISPSSSSDSPQSGNSFVSSSASSEIGNVYECVSPPQIRQYNSQQAEFIDQNQSRMISYHRLAHCQPQMQMFS